MGKYQLKHGGSPKMTEAIRLGVYDDLREMHNTLKHIQAHHYPNMSEWDKNAIDAVESVLYLAEGVFATHGE